jgi:hypothetical protein
MAQTLIYLGRYAEANDLFAKARQKQREQDKLPGLWKRVDVPEHIFERMLGFSIPLDHEVVIISYDNILGIPYDIIIFHRETHVT